LKVCTNFENSVFISFFLLRSLLFENSHPEFSGHIFPIWYFYIVSIEEIFEAFTINLTYFNLFKVKYDNKLINNKFYLKYVLLIRKSRF